jgi:hypothetical protein
MTDAKTFNFGPVKRWTDEDGIMWAENDFIRLAWAYTDDPGKVGKFGWYGPRQVCVEFIARPVAGRDEHERCNPQHPQADYYYAKEVETNA